MRRTVKSGSHMKKLWLGVSLAAAIFPFGLFAAEGNVAEQSPFDFDAGGDFRFRYEFKDNWMDKGKTTVNPAYEDYYRMRSRVWGRATYGEDLGLYLRMANEFRDYRNSPENGSRNKFPDELFIDNLYLDVKNLGDRVDLRLGRQDIKQGAGRLISDGTPGDGSRSTYFDAILAKVRILEKSDIDLMATWNRYHDRWTIGNPHDPYDLTKIKSGSPYSKMDEAGLMAYAHYNEVQDFPMEFYWVWKMEERFYDKAVRYPGRQFHTVGTRLLPKLTDTLSAEVEAALQVGRTDSQAGLQDRNLLAWMGYAGLTYADKAVRGKPKVTGAVLYLSGDSDSYYKTADGSTDNGWNPVFNRSTWFSELYSATYDQYRWSNLIYPHLAVSVEPISKHKVSLQIGPMFADERDNGASDAYRGLYTQIRYDFPLLSNLFGKRGDLSGAVVGEVFRYGDYYQHQAVGEDTASWVRFELNGKL